ncbi:MAG: polymerase subunit sigma-24 [Frankiales bacterium]|nr:polymerase subunit sigma-24 [Frankiales bacterium]
MAPVPLAAGAEGELLRAAARGRPDAVRWLLDDIAPVVHGFVWARVAGDQAIAEDLVQETLLAAVSQADSFRGDAQVTTWMCGIARHLVARHWERERRADVMQSRLRLEPVPDLDQEQLLLDREEVAAALRRLPALHRQVLVLKYLDGLSVEEIAADVGRTRVQVQSLLQRARDGLRRELGERDA